MNKKSFTTAARAPIKPDFNAAIQFIRSSFEHDDRLAVVALNKRSARVHQRLGPASEIVSPAFQSWLAEKNLAQFEIYVSMNALKADATGRTKSDIGLIRHVYLDFDEDGDAALQRLRERSDLPPPNYVVSTSPGKWQVLWRVSSFQHEHAEELQRRLARSTGADIAATDRARVLRMPGFYNHKYEIPHLVKAQTSSDRVHTPDDFATLRFDDPFRAAGNRDSVPRRGTPLDRQITQSERDWAFAKRALARGDNPRDIAAAIAVFRRFDKPDPNYYAELTVHKAEYSLQRRRMPEPEPER